MYRTMRAGKILAISVTALLAAAAVVRHFGPDLYVQETTQDSRFYVLDRGINGEPESLNPRNFRSNQAATILRDIGEGLVSYSPTGELIGGVAQFWHVSADGLTYQFDLRHSAKWSDGSPVEARDFVLAFRNLVDPAQAAGNSSVVLPIKNAVEILRGNLPVDELGIHAEGNGRVIIQLTSPLATFLQLLTHPSAFPALAPQAGNHSEFTEISNGAYKVTERVLGSEIRLDRNEHYWNAGNVAYDAVRYHVVEEAVELSRFRTGELDVTGNVHTAAFELVRHEYPDNLKVSPYLGVYYYGFNLEHEKFADNSALRHALSLAIDREVLVEKILGRGELPAYSWVPPGIVGYTPSRFIWAEMTRADRLNKARELFAESGYGVNNPLSLSLLYNSSDVQQRIALAIAAMWEDALGIQVELTAREFGIMLDEIKSDPTVELFRLSWTGDYIDPEAFLQIFRSDNPSNFAKFSSAEFDAALRSAQAEINPVARAALLSRAEMLVLEHIPVIPLYFYVSKHLVGDDVLGWKPNVLDIHQSQYLRPKSL